MFGRKPIHQDKTPVDSKPVWEMNDEERAVEQLARIHAFARFFEAKGAKVSVRDATLHMETPKNNYYIDVAAYEPRMMKIQTIYEIVPGNIDRASWACYNAQAVVHGTKAKAIPLGEGYRLHFTAEIMASNVEAFTSVADLYLALLEDCREAYIGMSKQAIEADHVQWSTQPQPRG